MAAPTVVQKGRTLVVSVNTLVDLRDNLKVVPRVALTVASTVDWKDGMLEDKLG